MTRFLAALILILSLTLVLQYTRQAPPEHVGDNHGSRIVSLAPSLTEILFELGVGERVVGVTNYCTHPPEALLKTRVGGFLNPNLEKIVDLQPDLILAEHWPSSRAVPRLRAFALNVLEIPSPTSLEEIYQSIRAVGELVERSPQAEALIDSMRSRLRGVEERGAQFPYRPSVYVEIDLPSWTIGKKSFITEALHLCGARNLFDDVERSSLLASKEIIIDRSPDLIVTYTVSAAEMNKRPGWDQIEAVRKRRILDDLDQDLLSHGNHRLIEGMEQLQARIVEILRSSEG